MTPTLRTSLWILALAVIGLNGCKESATSQTSVPDLHNPPVTTPEATSRDDVAIIAGGSQTDASGRYEHNICVGEFAVVTISTGGRYENRSDFFMPSVIPAGISVLIPEVEESNANSVAMLVEGDEKRGRLA